MRRSTGRVGLAAGAGLMLVTAFTIATASAASADHGPDLSSVAAIESYLISIGVDPAEAVWQDGLRNYAGSSCPGVGWSCVPADAPIVQIAAPLGTNVFECARLDCVAVQVALGAGQNDADCDRGDKHADDAVQVCLIVQQNTTGNNVAVINQSIEQHGSIVTARQVAGIRQFNESGKNAAGFHQVINQSSQVRGTEQSQEAHQAATLDQETETGDNTSNIDQRQSQTQRASRSPEIIQAQNTMVGPDFLFCDRPEDAPTFDQQKNQCAEVLQTSSVAPAIGGANLSNLRQTIVESQTASRSPTADQQQGNDCLCLGQQGTVTQHSSTPVDSESIQETRQSQTASGVPEAGLSQFKDAGDPRCCATQTINPASSADIRQITRQSASSDEAMQTAEFAGTCNSSGSCHVLQSATIDGDTDTNECTDTDPPGMCNEVQSCTEVTGEGGTETVCNPPVD